MPSPDLCTEEESTRLVHAFAHRIAQNLWYGCQLHGGQARHETMVAREVSRMPATARAAS